MNWLERLLLKRICKKLVMPSIKDNDYEVRGARIAEYYRVMRDAMLQEFTEDNWQRLEEFSKDIHEEAWIPESDGAGAGSFL